MDTEAALRQVIVNTHSPVLVNELIQWQSDNNVSVWLSRLNSLITDIDGQRIKIKITKMSPVLKEHDNYEQLSFRFIPVSEPERKFNLNEVVKYLQTVDPENALKAIQ